MTALFLILVLFGSIACSSMAPRIPALYGPPPSMDVASVTRLPQWQGIPFEVQDERPLPPQLMFGGPKDTLWLKLSGEVVAETQRIMLEAVGPPKANNGPRNLAIAIMDYKVSLSGYTWTGTSTIRAQARRMDVVEQEWQGVATITQHNWWGTVHAQSTLKDAYRAAMNDLLRQLATARVPD